MNRENTARRHGAGRAFRSVSAWALLAAMLLGGCGNNSESPEHMEDLHASAAVETEPSYTVPPDGNQDDVTCKGSYTGTYDGETVVAEVGKEKLTNPELNVFYRLAVNSFLAAGEEQGPDLSIPLEGQMVPGMQITWQQFFLGKALETWHTVRALEQKSLEHVTREEKYFTPDPEFHAKYMGDVPANDVLYTLDATYIMSTMHREYLESLETTLKQTAENRGYADLDEMIRMEFGEQMTLEALLEAVKLANQGYMYFTELTYDLEPSKEAVEEALTPSGEYVIDLRHMLLIPEGATRDAQGRVKAMEEQWAACEKEMKEYHHKWIIGRKWESIFANQAHQLSQDPYTALNGGLLENIEKGQLIEPLDSWCFDPARKDGDVEMIKSDFGWHLVYFRTRRDADYEKTLSQLRKAAIAPVLEEILQAYPVKNMHYDRIVLDEIRQPGKVTLEADLLYPDVGHERISEPPVYLQQDYRMAPFGGYYVSSHGCGITTMAMLSTYMADTILTPGMMAIQYARYGSGIGTDGNIFWEVPPDLGYYPMKKVFYEWDTVEKALKEGRKVVSLQYKGYFTRGGHYLLLSEINDDGTVVIRDSNIYNYTRLPEHKKDAFPGEVIPRASQIFWIFDYKILSLPNCIRCGDCPRKHELDLRNAGQIVEDYLCPKCRRAMDRRQCFLELAGIS